MAKDGLVEINLQLMSADAVVRSDQSLLKIPNGAVGERHTDLAPLRSLFEVVACAGHVDSLPHPSW